MDDAELSMCDVKLNRLDASEMCRTSDLLNLIYIHLHKCNANSEKMCSKQTFSKGGDSSLHYYS